MFRSFLAVVLGFVLAGGAVAVVERVGHRIYPPPSDLDPTNQAALKAYMERAAIGALAFQPLAWFVGTLAGTWLATLISRRLHFLHAAFVGLLMLGASVFMLLVYPAPGWMIAMGLAAAPVATFLGYRLAPKRRPTPPTVLAVHPRYECR
jgi:hypothetical protein